MSTELKSTGIDAQELADQEAVLRHLADGTPLDPEVVRRVHERAAPIVERIRQVYGVIDDETFQSLLGDDDEA